MAQYMIVKTIVESLASQLYNIHDHRLPVNSILHWLGYANNNHKLVVNLLFSIASKMHLDSTFLNDIISGKLYLVICEHIHLCFRSVLGHSVLTMQQH